MNCIAVLEGRLFPSHLLRVWDTFKEVNTVLSTIISIQTRQISILISILYIFFHSIQKKLELIIQINITAIIY